VTRKNRAREPLTATAGKIDPQLTVQLVDQRPSAISLAAHAWQSREAPSGVRCRLVGRHNPQPIQAIAAPATIAAMRMGHILSRS
jgi:hypothetical protein